MSACQCRKTRYSRDAEGGLCTCPCPPEVAKARRMVRYPSDAGRHSGPRGSDRDPTEKLDTVWIPATNRAGDLIEEGKLLEASDVLEVAGDYFEEVGQHERAQSLRWRSQRILQTYFNDHRSNYGYGDSRRMIARALGFTGDGNRYPKNASAEGVLPDGRRVRLIASAARERKRSAATRIWIECRNCRKWIPAGRIGQHTPSSRCRYKRPV